MRVTAVLPDMVPVDQKVLPGASDEIHARALAAARALRESIPWSGYSLSGWDALSGTDRHVTLASEGYSASVLDHMNTGFVESNPAFEILHNKVPSALRWRDLRRDWHMNFAETVTAEDYLIPAGYNEGATLCLRLPNGRYTGSLHVSWSSLRHASDEARYRMEEFGPLLAIVCDLLRSADVAVQRLGAGANAVLVSADGNITELPGRPAGLHLAAGGELRQLAARQPRHPGRRRFLWADADGLCHRVESIMCGNDVMLVTEREIAWPFGLSRRELQILDLVADGLTNPDIAHWLGIRPRTVSTHVEHILEKLRCWSRAQLAAVAIRESLLLLGPGPGTHSRPAALRDGLPPAATRQGSVR